MAVRTVVVLVSLGLIAFLLHRGQMSPQVRIVVLAALGYYVLRLWVVGSRSRRAREANRMARRTPSSPPGAPRAHAGDDTPSEEPADPPGT